MVGGLPVIAVYSDTGTKLISYRYDAWGNKTTTYSNGGASTLAANNRITYRGYYYDADLEMYYLQSRYYDAKICRFINADSLLFNRLLGCNLFAYCENNPVTREDPNGKGWFCEDIDLDEDDLMERGGGGSNYCGPGSSYYNYYVRTRTAAADAYYGGYYSPGLTSAMKSLGSFYVSDAVSVTDSMATDRNVSSNNHRGYTPPSGGGGTTSQIKINGITITFGHGGRHLTTTKLSISDVERAIANDVVLKPAVYTKLGKEIINIRGYNIEYHYRTLSDIWINVGTYFEPR